MNQDNNNKITSSTNRLTPRREKLLEESKTLRGIMSVIRNRLESSSKIHEMMENGIIGEEYAAERQALLAVNNLGVAEGIVAAAVTFLTLRRGPAIVSRLVMKRQGTPAATTSTTTKLGGYKLESPPSANPFQNTGAQQQPAAAYRGSIFLRGAKLGLDIFVSLLMGASTSMYFTDEKQMVAQVASIPLVQGRSVVSDEFCQVIQAEIQRRPKSYWRHVESPYLQQLKVFCDNCRKRQVYEAKLRAEQGLRPDEPVSIPMPGVPVDYIVPEEVDNDDNQASVGDSSDDEFFKNYFPGVRDDKQDELEWVDSLVTDQEDDDKRKS